MELRSGVGRVGSGVAKQAKRESHCFLPCAQGPTLPQPVERKSTLKVFKISLVLCNTAVVCLLGAFPLLVLHTGYLWESGRRYAHFMTEPAHASVSDGYTCWGFELYPWTVLVGTLSCQVILRMRRRQHMWEALSFLSCRARRVQDSLPYISTSTVQAL